MVNGKYRQSTCTIITRPSMCILKLYLDMQFIDISVLLASTLNDYYEMSSILNTEDTSTDDITNPKLCIQTIILYSILIHCLRRGVSEQFTGNSP